MNREPDYDSQAKRRHAAEIEQIENTLLALTQRYLSNQIPYKDLVAYCVDKVLSHKATRYIDKDTYLLMCEIAVIATETNAITESLKHFLKTNTTT